MGTQSHPQEVDHLRDRLRLYVQVMLFVDIYAHVDDLVAPLLIEDLAPPALPPTAMVLRHLATVVLVVSWAVTRYAKPRRAWLLAIEVVVTVGLTVIYAMLATSYLEDLLPSFGPVFSLLGIMLLLVVRASLVPSTVTRTVVTGVISAALWLYFALPTLDGMSPIAFDGLTFIAVAFIVATATTSHVIYGLRRQVRQALRLGQYELGRKIGEGGMGAVYEATHVMLRRPTAVKLLPPERVGVKTIARFEREVKQTSRLEHPNTVEIYDYGRTPEGQFYYAMELLRGVTLERLVEESGPIVEARAVHILRQAARALAEAHARGLVHRDVKPANIMLCDRGGVSDMVKVLDFGLVKELENPEPDPDVSHANTIVGTPRYLAPEAIASPEEVGAASDIYALGAIGFFLVTGREVFTGRSVIEICSQHLNAVPESPSALRGEDLEPELEALILSCLAKSPHERPADGAALAEALERLDATGWSVADARRWWDDNPPPSTAGVEPSTSPTQLAVDVDQRS